MPLLAPGASGLWVEGAVFVWCGLERNLLLSGVRRLNQKILESPQRSIPFPWGFRWKLVTEMDCLRREPHPPSR